MDVINYRGGRRWKYKLKRIKDNITVLEDKIEHLQRGNRKTYECGIIVLKITQECK